MVLTLEPPIVPITLSPQGVALVRGTRVPIDTVITAFEQGDAPEEIAQNFPTVTVADAYAVIAYYLQLRSAHPSAASKSALVSLPRESIHMQPLHSCDHKRKLVYSNCDTLWQTLVLQYPCRSCHNQRRGGI